MLPSHLDNAHILLQPSSQDLSDDFQIKALKTDSPKPLESRMDRLKVSKPTKRRLIPVNSKIMPKLVRCKQQATVSSQYNFMRETPTQPQRQCTKKK
jgi:hypothetical protein